LNQTRINPDNHTGLALVHALYADWPNAHAELERADRLLVSDPAPHRIANFLTSAARIYLEEGDYGKAQTAAEKLKEQSRGDRYSSIMAEAIVKIAWYARERAPVLDLAAEETGLKNIGSLYELGLLKKHSLVVLYQGDRSAHWPEIIAQLSDGMDIFKHLGCRAELEALQKFQARVLPDLAAELIHRPLTDPYLATFSRLAELISEDLGADDFPDRILDLVIAATRAERGALFIKRAKSMEMIAGRGLDKTTLQDAQSFSQSILSKLGRAEIVFVPNALANPDFNLKKSVVLNQIRSILCIPLVLTETIVGAIYLDSRIPDRAFDPRDRDFLQAVSRILAAVIEKSFVLSATRDENVLLKSNIIREIGNGYLVGRSRAMKQVYKSVEDTAPTDLPVLILGETGTGKGMIARLIHLKSRRRAKRFLTINCGTIPETLLESELFGHKKGSFTGAISDKRGLLEEAGGGTVFLDEITNTSLAFQAKLLEAIEEKTIRRVGETVTRKIDVRFLFATNQDLEIEVEEGRFRKDLYYRINVFEVEIPPLRDRRNDIPQLAQLFLERFRREINKNIDGFTDKATARLKNKFWPGNVRELQNVIERSVIQTKNRLITPDDIGDRAPVWTDGKTIKSIKKEAIIEEMKATQGDIQQSAKNLGINRRTIQRYIKKYKI
jgi:Nif-specific regulatory protein